jgi:hypothetical protein
MLSQQITDRVREGVDSLPDVLVQLIAQYADRVRLLLFGGYYSAAPREPLAVELFDGKAWQDVSGVARFQPFAEISKRSDGRTMDVVQWPRDGRTALIHQNRVQVYDVHTDQLLFDIHGPFAGPTMAFYFVLHDKLHVLHPCTGVLHELEGRTWTPVYHHMLDREWRGLTWGHQSFASVVDEESERLYIIVSSGTARSYNCATSETTTLAGLHYHRTFFSAVLLHRRLYVVGCGGTSGDGAHRRVEWLDMTADSDNQLTESVWSETAPMCEARWGPAVCVVDDKIVALGGRQAGGMSTPTAECFDPKHPYPLWTDMPQCLFAREDARLVAF